MFVCFSGRRAHSAVAERAGVAEQGATARAAGTHAGAQASPLHRAQHRWVKEYIIITSPPLD